MKGVVILLLTILFSTPAFLSLAAHNDGSISKDTSIIQAKHSQILLTVLLRENEENESKDGIESYFLAQPLIDFSDHNLALIESRTPIQKTVYVDLEHDHQPPLFYIKLYLHHVMHEETCSS